MPRLAMPIVLLLLVWAAPAQAAPGDIVAGDFFYKAYRVKVQPGATVGWIMDPAGSPHTVTSNRGAPEDFDSGDKAPGERYSRVFTKAGRYSYFCTIHPGIMSGVVQVGDDTVKPKLSAVSARTGSRRVRVEFFVNEEAVVRAVFTRRGRVVKRVRTKQLREGDRSLAITRPRTAGRYAVKLTATDLEGNAGRTVTKRFAVPAKKRG